MSSSAENETHSNGGYTNRGLKKGPWSSEEDEKLKAYVYSLQAQYPTKKGVRNWNSVSKSAGLSRCGRSCRLRWMNHLDKDVKKGPFSKEEEKLFFELHAKLGGFKWSKMALQLKDVILIGLEWLLVQFLV
ncbi:myb-related protein 315 [Medicago truncatula]|uniref:myb-related protein 315 n=1 Tax=Medicago truncatula TaxID=3880 RepID=UPI001966E56F|nr:myb-related protein 315-like [Medicago truncatula]